MQRISSLASSIYADYPNLHFVEGVDFIWSPGEQTIYHPELTSIESIWSLLHEVAHAELQHTSYSFDVELVQREVAAWKHMQANLAPKYDVAVAADYIEDHLDTYRIWLHARSTCPDCGQNGLQTKNTYSCVNCRCVWRANEARICNLRRTKLRQ